MRLRPGQDSGGYGNEHPRSDQVLYVLDGGGVMIRFKNTGRTVFKAITFYAPPAY